jgi:ketosteroid isomerase-like protein
MESNVGQSNVDVVKRYLEAANSKDIKTMDSLLADNFVGYGPSFADSIDKQSALKNWTLVAQDYYDEVHISDPMMIAARSEGGAHPGDWVAAWSQVRLTYKDTARRPVTIFANVIYRVENGKIAMLRRFYNEADIQRQSGFNPIQVK